MIGRPTGLLLALAVAAVTLTMSLVGVAATVFGTSTPDHHGWKHGRCFPSTYWTPPAPDRYRPCARIVAVQEDGSVTVSVSDHDGTERFRFDRGALDR